MPALSRRVYFAKQARNASDCDVHPVGTGNPVASHVTWTGEPAQIASAANSLGHFDCSWPHPLSQLASSGGPPAHFAATTPGQIDVQLFCELLLLELLHASPLNARPTTIAEAHHPRHAFITTPLSFERRLGYSEGARAPSAPR